MNVLSNPTVESFGGTSGKDKQRQAEAALVLDQEEEARKRRIALRREQRAKAEAEARRRRRNKAFKLSGVWAAVIVGGFMAATWFSTDFIVWLDSLRHTF